MPVEHETFISLCRSRDYIAENYGRRVSLAEAADVAYLSPFHFQRLFSHTFGESPQEFLMRRRLESAKKLLSGSPLTVSEVCLEVGYESLGSFSTLFRKIEGVAPTEFRRVYHMPRLYALKQIPACALGMFRRS